MPQPPPNNASAVTNIIQRINSIQKYMSELQYNHVGTQFFEIRKNRPISGFVKMCKCV